MARIPGRDRRAAFPGRLAGAALCLLLLAVPAHAKPGKATFSPWTGGPTPALVLQDANGRQHDLADYRGKVVLVNFWATWCEPCREEMPSLEALQDRYRGRPLAVLTVNMAESEARVRLFMDSTLLQRDSLTVLYDSFGNAARRWKARLLPVTFVIGADGRVRYTLLGAADWTSPEIVAKIAALLPGRAGQ